MRRYRNQVVAGLLFISLALIAVVVLTGADALAEKLDDFPLTLFAPVIALKALNWALRYGEWRYFLGVIGVRTVWGEPAPPAPGAPDAPATIRERDSVVLWLAGLTLSISPGKVAEVLKALVLKNMTGVDFSRSAPVIVLERIVDGLAVIVLVALSLAFVAGSFGGSDLSAGYTVAVLAITTAAMIAGIAVVQVRPLSLWLLDRAAGWPLVGRFQPALRTFYESSYTLLKLRHLMPTVLLGIGAYFSDAVGFYILLRGLGVAGSGTLFASAVFILGFSVIVAALSAMPGGAGGRELTVGALLTSMVGLSRADAGTATFLISIFQVWLGVLVGLGVIALFRRTLFPPALEDELAAYRTLQQPR